MTAPMDATELRAKLPSRLIAEAIDAHWGERCAVFDPECWTCMAWARLDELDRVEQALADAEHLLDEGAAWEMQVQRAESSLAASEAALSETRKTLEAEVNDLRFHSQYRLGLAFALEKLRRSELLKDGEESRG